MKMLSMKRVHPGAIPPKYATLGSACFDLFAIDEPRRPGFVVGPIRIFNTGWQFEIPEGYVMLIFSRSGHGFKKDTRLANCVGVIDSDYRGEVLVKLRCDSSSDYPVFKNGDAIAQAMILPIEQVGFVETTELSQTERGENGFGSTGN